MLYYLIVDESRQGLRGADSGSPPRQLNVFVHTSLPEHGEEKKTVTGFLLFYVLCKYGFRQMIDLILTCLAENKNKK